MGKRLRKYKIGTYRFDGKVTITDPCYNDDVWCRFDKDVKPGEYTCRIWKDTDSRRVGIIGIYLDDFIPLENSMTVIGSIGVDAGLAGFFQNKPNYSNEQWNKFCDEVFENPEKDAWIRKEGFFSSSGIGDGCYGVWAGYNNEKEITSLEIRFG